MNRVLKVLFLSLALLLGAMGCASEDPGLAAVIQEVVWEVVQHYSWAGVD